MTVNMSKTFEESDSEQNRRYDGRRDSGEESIGEISDLSMSKKVIKFTVAD